jgi:hypothetical protein
MHKKIKALPEYLQPKILSAVAYVHECSPDINKAVEEEKVKERNNVGYVAFNFRKTFGHCKR